MEKEIYIDQYREVEKATAGMTMDEVRTYFANSVSNDFTEGGVRYIDANYKDILVTFVGPPETEKAEIQDDIEVYSKEGIFLGHFWID